MNLSSSVALDTTTESLSLLMKSFVNSSLVMYLILYYRFRDDKDYIRYVLKALASNIRKIPYSKDNILSFNMLLDELPPHDETEAELTRLESVPEETVRERYVKAQEEIRRLRMRVEDLETELKDSDNAEATKEDNEEDSPRFYKRKLQVTMLMALMERAGIDISKNKTAAAILISNLLHVSNYKAVQKMLSEKFYLRAAEHGEACAEINGILKVLASKLSFKVKASKTSKELDQPIKDYLETIKLYKNSGRVDESENQDID